MDKKKQFIAMKINKKYHTVETVSNSHRRTVETEAKSILLTNIYSNTAHVNFIHNVFNLRGVRHI